MLLEWYVFFIGRTTTTHDEALGFVRTLDCKVISHFATFDTLSVLPFAFKQCVALRNCGHDAKISRDETVTELACMGPSRIACSMVAFI